jgi:hypothetical protein
MCKKVDARIECIKCGYPICEARYPDCKNPLPCDATDKQITEYLNEIESYSC